MPFQNVLFSWRVFLHLQRLHICSFSKLKWHYIVGNSDTSNVGPHLIRVSSQDKTIKLCCLLTIKGIVMNSVQFGGKMDEDNTPNEKQCEGTHRTSDGCLVCQLKFYENKSVLFFDEDEHSSGGSGPESCIPILSEAEVWSRQKAESEGGPSLKSPVDESRITEATRGLSKIDIVQPTYGQHGCTAKPKHHKTSSGELNREVVISKRPRSCLHEEGENCKRACNENKDRNRVKPENGIDD